MTRPALSRRLTIPVGVLLVLVGVGAGYAATALRSTPRIRLTASPESRTVRPGATRLVGLRVTRRHFSGPVLLRLVGRTPRGIVVTLSGPRSSQRCRYRSAGRPGCTFRLPRTRTRAQLRVQVARSTRTGTYRLRLRAARPGGRVRKTITVKIVVPGVSVVSASSQGSSPPTLVAEPARRGVPAGTEAQFPITIERDDETEPVTVRVTSALPEGVTARVTPQPVTGREVTVAFASDNATTPDGSYPVQVQATSAGGTSTLTLTLVISTPPGMSFPIAGDVGELAPGITKPIELTLTNPNDFSISVVRLGVELGAISGPDIDADHPCGAVDFRVDQAADAIYPLVVPPGQHTLTELGVPRDAWPRISLLDRPVNQDGCKGAVEDLVYDGMAQRTPR